MNRQMKIHRVNEDHARQLLFYTLDYLKSSKLFFKISHFVNSHSFSNKNVVYFN